MFQFQTPRLNKKIIGIIKFDVNEMGSYQGQQISFRASTECESSV